MFRRKSKLDANPPKPLTKAEILEDLETFSMGFINRKDSSFLETLSTSDASPNLMDSPKSTKHDRKESGIEHQLHEWWNIFEKFLGDIDKLKTHQKQFETKKTSLSKLDETIGLMADDIQTRITDSLEKATAEISESEQDLK